MEPTPRRRLSTSNGYMEPQSQLLQQALRERRGSTTTPQPRDTPGRAKPTTPRRPSMRGARPVTDEWLTAVEQPPPRSHSTGPSRPQKRRASMSAAGSEDAQRPGISLKDTSAQIDKLQKQAFDLKLRISLQDDCMKKLTRELEETKDKLEESYRLQQRFLVLEEQVDVLENDLLEARNARDQYKTISEDLMAENNELKTALDEAAVMIDMQEREMHLLAAQSVESPGASEGYANFQAPAHLAKYEEQADSDYYSAEPDTPITATSVARLRQRASSSSGQSFRPAESDYYSNTTQSSPKLACPKTPRASERKVRIQPGPIDLVDLRRKLVKDPPSEPVLPQALPTIPPIQAEQRQSPLASPTEMLTPRPSLRRTRRTQAAALASMRLNNAEQPVSRPPVALRNRQQPAPSLQPAIEAPILLHAGHEQQGSAFVPAHVRDVLGRCASLPPQEELTQQGSNQWSRARPLHMLYQTGELGRPVTAGADSRLRVPGEAPANATPSTMLDDLSDCAGGDSRSPTPTSRNPRYPPRPLPLFANKSLAPFRNSTGTMPVILARDRVESTLSRSRSSTLSIPDTITTTTPMRKRGASGSSECGSQYSSYLDASYSNHCSAKDGSPPWNVSREVLERPSNFAVGAVRSLRI